MADVHDDLPWVRRQHAALAIRVVEAGWRGYFTTADDMTRTLVRAQVEGNWAAKLKAYTAPIVLVIDDVGLLPIRDRDAAGAFFHVVNTRTKEASHHRDNQPWAARLGQIFGDPVAAAILDRLMHNAVVFNITGPSWRLREHHALAAATTTSDPT